MSTKFIGKGTTLNIGSGTDGGQLVGVLDIKQPNVKVADVEVTDYDDTIEQYIAGWYNAGEVEAEVFYQKAQSESLLGLVGEDVSCTITFPNANGVYTFTGYVNSHSGEIPLKAAVKNKFKIRLTSKPALA